MSKIKLSDNRKGLIVICTASFLFPFMGSALNLALPEISLAFSMKAVTLTWMALSYMISSAIFQIPFARLADLIGRKKVFLLGIVIFSVFCSSVVVGIIFTLFGKIEVTLRGYGEKSCVFAGIGIFGIRKKFDWYTVKSIYGKSFTRRSDGSDWKETYIIIEGSTQIKFGSRLSGQKQSFIVQALRYIHENGM